jgi:hypothetical protein
LLPKLRRRHLREDNGARRASAAPLSQPPCHAVPLSGHATPRRRTTPSGALTPPARAEHAHAPPGRRPWPSGSPSSRSPPGRPSSPTTRSTQPPSARPSSCSLSPSSTKTRHTACNTTFAVLCWQCVVGSSALGAPRQFAPADEL